MNRITKFTKLRERGLTYAEAMPLSRIETTGIDYFQDYMRSRRVVLSEWKKWKKRYPKISPTRQSYRYHKMVREWYVDHGWLDKNGRIDPWAAYRHYEKKWKDSPRGDGYVKPAKKKARVIRNTNNKLEKALGF
jgi:hypothetical protein